MTKELEIKIAVVETQLISIEDRLEKIEKKQDWFFMAVAGAFVVQLIGLAF